MKERELYQVNRHESVDGNITYSVTKYSEDGYHGHTVDTEYSDGADTTDWCIVIDTKANCNKYVDTMMLRNKLIKWIHNIPHYRKNIINIYSIQPKANGLYVIFGKAEDKTVRSSRTIPYADLV